MDLGKGEGELMELTAEKQDVSRLTDVLSAEQLLFTAKLLGLAVVVKVLPCLLFVFGGLPVLKSLNIGLLMTSRLSLIIFGTGWASMKKKPGMKPITTMCMIRNIGGSCRLLFPPC